MDLGIHEEPEKNSLLSNLSQLTLLLTDEKGKKLSIYDQTGKNIIGAYHHPVLPVAALLLALGAA